MESQILPRSNILESIDIAFRLSTAIVLPFNNTMVDGGAVGSLAVIKRVKRSESRGLL